METRRLFWLAVAWFGATQALRWGLVVYSIGLFPGNAVGLVGGAALLLAGLVGQRRPALLGGPTERTPVFWGAVAAAVLGTAWFLF